MSTQGHQHLEKEAIFSCSQFETVAVHTVYSKLLPCPGSSSFFAVAYRSAERHIHCTVCTVRAEFHENRASVWICVSISGEW